MLRPTGYSLIITGLGGQGVLSASKAIASAAKSTYPFVLRTESRGLSQRGGSVCSEVRFGFRPVAPAIGLQSADLILGFDALEAARILKQLKPDGAVITTRDFTPPFHLITDWRDSYETERAMLEERLLELFAELPNVCILDLKTLRELGEGSQAENTAVLGAACEYLPIPFSTLRNSASQSKNPASSLRAFDFGFSARLTHEPAVQPSAVARAF